MHCFAALVAGVGLAIAARPQTAGAPDPYAADRAAAVKLGYAGTGPFLLGDDHTSTEVAAGLGNTALHWVETAHFRIGTDLADCALPDETRDQEQFTALCRELHRRVAAIPEQPKSLDGWLRLHLLARRLELLYAEVERLAGVDDGWFAEHPLAGGKGNGRWLGCPQPFVVLVFQRESDLMRYLRNFCGCSRDIPWASRYRHSGNYLFATAAQACHRELMDPAVLDAHIAHFAASNLLEAFVGSARTPFWWREGLSHWLARRVNRQVVTITELPDDRRWRFAAANWEQMVRTRTQARLLPPADELLCWREDEQRELDDHALIWSFVDFLMAQDRAAVAGWFRRLRAEPPPRAFAAEPELAWHDAAFAAAFGRDRPRLFADWQRFVLDRYAKK